VTLLLLRAGRLAVDLAPDAGGSIARFAVDGSDVLRPGLGTRPRGNESACYPLVPFSNRIANGRFVFDGKQIEMAPNWPGVAHPMHGDGWAASWRVLSSSATEAEIAYEHDGRSGWPFRYRARQNYRLRPEALEVRISLDNREAHAVPGGIGLHPFFVRDPDVELFFDADSVWLADAEVLPTNRVPVPDAWDFCHGRRPDSVALDNCFEGWDGEASVVWPSRKLRLRLEASEPFRHAVVFTPPARPFFCFEPVSHANGQIAATRLAAGATLAGTVSFSFSNF